MSNKEIIQDETAEKVSGGDNVKFLFPDGKNFKQTEVTPMAWEKGLNKAHDPSAGNLYVGGGHWTVSKSGILTKKTDNEER